MSSFLSSSCDLAVIVGGITIRTAFLPVTLPLQLASTATNALVGTCAQVVSTAGNMIQDVSRHHTPEGQDSSSLPLIHAFFFQVFQVVPLTLNVATKIKDGVGSTVLQLVSPVLGHGEDTTNEGRGQHHVTSSGQSPPEHESFLDRLRIDYNSSTPSCCAEGQVHKIKLAPSNSDVSKYLLHVEDLDLATEEAPVPSAIVFIDLSKDHRDEILTEQALCQLVARGLSLINNVDGARLRNYTDGLPLGCVQWKPENSTEKLLRSLSDDWIQKLKRNVLIWSGRMQGRWARGHDFPFFLARKLPC